MPAFGQTFPGTTRLALDGHACLLQRIQHDQFPFPCRPTAQARSPTLQIGARRSARPDEMVRHRQQEDGVLRAGINRRAPSTAMGYIISGRKPRSIFKSRAVGRGRHHGQRPVARHVRWRRQTVDATAPGRYPNQPARQALLPNLGFAQCAVECGQKGTVCLHGIRGLSLSVLMRHFAGDRSRGFDQLGRCRTLARPTITRCSRSVAGRAIRSEGDRCPMHLPVASVDLVVAYAGCAAVNGPVRLRRQPPRRRGCTSHPFHDQGAGARLEGFPGRFQQAEHQQVEAQRKQQGDSQAFGFGPAKLLRGSP